jgi:hypothetical protein
MTGTRIYQGWRYTFDLARPAKERWQATRGANCLDSPSEAGIKKLIDKFNEDESQAEHRIQSIGESLAHLTVMG